MLRAPLSSTVAASLGLALLAGCPAKNAPSGESGKATSGATTADPAALAARGKSVYMGNCISCHNLDPARDGGVGPRLAGSSLELIEARVLRAEYPAGYVPQRTSHLMPAQAHLKKDIAALYAFLNQKP